MELASICRRARTPGSKYRYSFAIAERDRWFACRARANPQLHPAVRQLTGDRRLTAGPTVRIRFPPADSLSLSRSLLRRSRIRLSARVCTAGSATESAETRKAFRCAPTPWVYLCRAIFQYRSAAYVVGENVAPLATKLGFLGA